MGGDATKAQWQGRWRTHKKFVIAVAGAVLVVVMFGVKEDKREEMKSLADSIAAAESTFVIRSESERVYDLLNHSRHPIEILAKSPPDDHGVSGGAGSGDWSMAGWDADESELKADNSEVQAAKISLNNIEELSRKIPKKEALADRTATIRKDIEQFDKDWARYQSDGLLYKHHRTKSELDRLRPHLELGDRIDSQCDAIRQSVENLGMETLQAARVAREDAEHKVDLLRIVCYGLTVASATLAVIGVFMGVEVSGHE